MAEISIRDAVGQILAVLSEAFEGPAQQWSYFTDHGAEAGLLGVLEKLSATEASRPLPETTIAAHAHHVAFGLNASTAWLTGDRSSQDWQQSWSISVVNEEAWKDLRAMVRRRLDELRRAIESAAGKDVEAMGVSIAAAAHAAYHLGAVKQKVALLKRS